MTTLEARACQPIIPIPAALAQLAQRHVDDAPGEVPGFAPLLAGLDLAGAVVTADALHTHPGAAELLVAP